MATLDLAYERWNDATLTWDRIQLQPGTHNHDAAAIVSGVFADARIPALAISKITNLQSTLDGKIYYNDVLMPTNPFGGKKLYINHTDNALFAADKKLVVTVTRHLVSYAGETYPKLNPDYRAQYTVTGTGTTRQIVETPYPTEIVVFEENTLKTAPTHYSYNNSTGLITFTYTPSGVVYVYAGPSIPQYLDSPIDTTISSVGNLFDGSYESNITVANGYYLKIRMTGDGTELGNFSNAFGSYPYGAFYISYYYTGTPSNTYYRVYNYTYRPHTPGWKMQTLTDYVGTKSASGYIATTSDEGNYGRSIMEIIVVGHDTSGGAYTTSISQIDYKLSRPTLSVSGATVTKFGSNKLYYSLRFGDRTSDKVVINPDGSIALNGQAVVVTNDPRLSDSRPASDVYSWAKASSKPSYAFSEIGTKPTTLLGYGITDAAGIGHGHAGVYEPVFTKNTAFNKNFGSAAGTVCEGNDSRLSDSRPASDVYAWAKASSKPDYAFSEIGSKPTTLLGYGITDAAANDHGHAGVYEPVFTKNTAFNKNFGSAAGTVCEGNDSRLSDSRPASDVYAWAKAVSKPAYAFSEIGSKPTTLEGYGISDAMSALATVTPLSSNTTLSSTYSNRIILASGAITLTLSSVSPHSVGSQITIVRTGTSTITIACSGVTINGSSTSKTITAQYKAVTLVCTATNTWVGIGF